MDFYKCTAEVLSAINQAKLYIEKTRNDYLSRDFVEASDKFMNFERVINVPEYKFEEHSIKIMVVFGNIKDKINWEDFIYIQSIISLIDDKFKSAISFTGHTLYLNVVAEMLDTLETSNALGKICDIAIEVLQKQYDDFQTKRAGGE